MGAATRLHTSRMGTTGETGVGMGQVCHTRPAIAPALGA